MVLKCDGLSEDLGVISLDRLHGSVVQFDDELREYVSCPSDASGVSTAGHCWQKVISKTGKDLEGTMFREVGFSLSVLCQSVAFTNTGTSKLGTEAVRVLGELDEKIGVEVDAGGGAAEDRGRGRRKEKKGIRVSVVGGLGEDFSATD